MSVSREWFKLRPLFLSSIVPVSSPRSRCTSFCCRLPNRRRSGPTYTLVLPVRWTGLDVGPPKFRWRPLSVSLAFFSVVYLAERVRRTRVRVNSRRITGLDWPLRTRNFGSATLNVQSRGTLFSSRFWSVSRLSFVLVLSGHTVNVSVLTSKPLSWPDS